MVADQPVTFNNCGAKHVTTARLEDEQTGIGQHLEIPVSRASRGAECLRRPFWGATRVFVAEQGEYVQHPFEAARLRHFGFIRLALKELAKSDIMG